MPILVDVEVAAEYTGHPAATIRTWAIRGLLTRYGRGRGRVRYDLLELHSAWQDADGITHPGATPEKPSEPRGRIAA